MTELGLLTNLDFLSLRANHFKGSIPSEFGLFHKMSWGLRIGSNKNVTGRIPTELGQLELAEDLYLDDTLLTGPVPSEIGRITGLRNFFAQDNPLLTGTLPDELAQLGSLGVLSNLNITGTSISGELPNAVCATDARIANCTPQPFVTEAVDCSGLFFDCSDSLCGCSCPCSSGSGGDETAGNST